MNLPTIIQKYIDASNAHDVSSIVACFASDAIVRDENVTRRGPDRYRNVGRLKQSRNTNSNSNRSAQMGAATKRF